MTWSDIAIKSSIWPPIIYYIVSIVVGVLLFIGKYIVHRRANLPGFLLYAFFVITITAVQFCLMRFGADFARDILRIDLDVYGYESIFNGTYIFTIIYSLALPTKLK
ncbi:hypothetical protein DT73_13200 [Mangrovibacter sp. MFB070]|uniref:hypothetical protein n=1 Tax=Mangrovibacter sp. MFB070 TaxID=1224318 RepID=UPI0004D436C1|nr:hypothetical protein [Mangrovibacter sp. MFB070]KEA51883.1 hypothetical protein DT73_13200 [Mangrovibacter sp. MFB070]